MKGYHNAIMQFQKQYNLKRNKAPTEPQRTKPISKPPVDAPFAIHLKPDNPNKDSAEKKKSKEALNKAPETSQEMHDKEVENFSPPFNFEKKWPRSKSLSCSTNLSKRESIGRRLLKC
jgi:hypothetical protein